MPQERQLLKWANKFNAGSMEEMEGMGKSFSIDLEKTGQIIKFYAEKNHYTAKDIQLYLGLSCPQPVYRWFKGIILPSVDNLLALSELFRVPMESLLMTAADNNTDNNSSAAYYLCIFGKNAAGADSKRLIKYMFLLNNKTALDYPSNDNSAFSALS